VSRPRRNGRDNGHQVRRGPERAVIAAVRLPRQRRWEVDESLAELGGLAVAAGATVVQRVSQERETPTPALFFGRG
jgi:50S ribosomal subunit-associated GTPase HflX